MLNKQKQVSAMVIACSLFTLNAYATLPSNAVFNIGTQTFTCALDLGVYPDCLVKAVPGNYFAMDTNGDGLVGYDEKIGVEHHQGIILGKAQPASGSHTGAIDGSEVPSIDKPWEFFGNTGMEQSLIAVTIVSGSDDGAGNVKLSFVGWSVTWNGLDNIPLGGNVLYPEDTGQAVVTCGNTCEDGDTYVLDYAAHVDSSVPSGFAGVPYTYHIEGTISIPEGLTTDAGGIGNGTIADAAGSTDMSVTVQDLLDNGIPEDSNFTYSGGLYDFIVTGVVTTAQIRIPLLGPIPADSVYRKYINGAWVTFTADGTNLVASAAKVSGTCPGVGDPAYDHTNGLVEDDECLQLTIADGGIYDADGAADASISDPGGVATAVIIFEDTRVSGTSGCSISSTNVDLSQRADWLIVAGFIVWLGLIGYRRNKAEN